MTQKVVKIGIIDSGIGGLTILNKLLSLNLNAEFYYISDERNVPYGNKSQQFMLDNMTTMSEKLISKGVEGILIACNTATAETIDKLRQSYSTTYVGIEPYLNYINKLSNHNDKVGLILTEATYNSERFKVLLEKLDPRQSIDIFPLKNLAKIIEKIKYRPFRELQNKIDNEIMLLKENKLTKIILGCTHYPIIASYLEKELDVKTIDPSDYVINQLVQKLSLKATNSFSQDFLYNYDNSELWKRTNINDLPFI